MADPMRIRAQAAGENATVRVLMVKWTVVSAKTLQA